MARSDCRLLSTAIDLIHVRAVPADGSIDVRGVADRSRRQRGKFVTRGLAAQDQVTGKVSLGIGFPDEAHRRAAGDRGERLRRRRRELVDRGDAGWRRWRALDRDGPDHFDATDDVATLGAELHSRIGERRHRQKRCVQRQNGCGRCARCAGARCGMGAPEPRLLRRRRCGASYTL